MLDTPQAPGAQPTHMLKPIALDDTVLAILLGTPGPRGYRGLPGILWGDPGMSKTTRCELAARALSEPCQVLTPQHDETTYGLVPMLDTDVKPPMVRTPPHEWVERIGKRGIIVLDDLTSHSGPVQAAQLRLLTHREVGSAELGPDVAIIGIANPVRQAANGRPLSTALANRVIHLQVKLTWAEAAQYLLDMTAQPFNALPQLISQIRSSFDYFFAKERRRMAGFITARGSAMDVVDERDDIDCVVMASSRSVELCTRAITAARILKADHLIPAIVAGSIGRGHVHAYVEYCERQNLPTDEQVLDGSWQPKHGESDVVFLVLGRLAQLIKDTDHQMRKPLTSRFWSIVERAVKPASEGGAQVPADIVVPAAKSLYKVGVLPPIGVASRILEEVVL